MCVCVYIIWQTGGLICLFALLLTILWQSCPNLYFGRGRHAFRPEKIGTVLKICHKIKSILPFCLILPCSEFQRSLQSFKTKASMLSLNYFFFYISKKNYIETDVIAAKMAMVDLVVELNLPLGTLDRINKVFKKSLRIQTLLKGQLKMFLFFMSAVLFFCH